MGQPIWDHLKRKQWLFDLDSYLACFSVVENTRSMSEQLFQLTVVP
jgi:hypothetical protein